MKIFTVSSALTRLCALILATFVALLAVPFASAADTGGVSPSLVDPARKATLHVHKYAGDPAKQYGDPSNPYVGDNKDLPGIRFFVQKIKGVELTTNEGWRKAQTYEISDFYESGKAYSLLGSKIAATTGADGVATFKDLDLGLYLVTEDYESAVKGNFTIAAPFVVALPSTNDERNAWNYDVTVDPKDQKISPNVALQCINDHSHFGTDDLKYKFSTSLPAPDREELTAKDEYVISSLKVSLPLDESQTYIDDSTEVYYGTYREQHLDTDKDKGSKLDKGDYTVKVAPGNVLVLVLTESGLAKVSKLRTGNPDAHITWLFNAKTSKEASKAKKKIAVAGYVTPPGYPEFDLVNRYGVVSDKAEQPLPCSKPGEPATPTPGPIPVPPIVPPAKPTPVPSSPTPGSTPTPVPPKKGTIGGLAMTGANSWLTIILGLVFVGLGIFFIRRNYQRN